MAGSVFVHYSGTSSIHIIFTPRRVGGFDSTNTAMQHACRAALGCAELLYFGRLEAVLTGRGATANQRLSVQARGWGLVPPRHGQLSAIPMGYRLGPQSATSFLTIVSFDAMVERTFVLHDLFDRHVNVR